MHPRGYRSLVIIALAALGLSPARADDDSDREHLISEINSRLDSAGTALSRVASDSDAGDVNDALGYVGEVADLVNNLAEVKGDDSTANDIVSRYPGYISDFRSTAPELIRLKGRQDSAKDFIRQCKAFDDAMTERARTIKDDPKSADELSAFAKSVGRKGEDLMSDAERLHSEVERNGQAARRFSVSDGEWSSVRDAMAQSSDAIVRAWTGDWEQAKKACEDVVKRERHPEIEKALGRLASSHGGRAELRKKLDELLGLIEGKVSDVQSQSDGSSVNGALELTKEIDSQLERLKAAQGDDEEAAKIAAEWPAWVKELRTSLEALQQMKQRQPAADDGAEKCTVAERALQEKIRGYVGDPEKHKEALKTLPVEARTLGDEWKAKMDAAGVSDVEMARWQVTAKSFARSDGPWGKVKGRLDASADRVFEHWHGKYTAMTKACERLVLGADNPDVKAAITEMERDTAAAATSYKELRAELNRWEEQVNQLRDWSAQDVEEIRQAFCHAPDVGEYDEVNAVADRWASQLNGLYGTITGTGDRIKQSADALIAKKRARVNGPKVKDAVDRILVSIAKVKEYQLAGSNNPLLKAQAAYGVAEHNQRQKSCDAKEVEISGDYCKNPNPKRTDCKMDCVKGCTIWEIKPRGAVDLGWDQVRAYKKAVEVLFEKKGEAGLTGKLSIFQSCIVDDGKTLKIEADVDPYDFCPKATDVGVVVEPPQVTVPEEEE